MKKIILIGTIFASVFISSCTALIVGKTLDAPAYVYVPKKEIDVKFLMSSDKYLSKDNEAKICSSFWNSLKSSLSSRNIVLYYYENEIPSDLRNEVYRYEINYFELQEEGKVEEVRAKTDSTEAIRLFAIKCNMILHSNLTKDNFKDNNKSNSYQTERGKGDRETIINALTTKKGKEKEVVYVSDLSKDVFNELAVSVGDIEAAKISAAIKRHLKREQKKQDKYKDEEIEEDTETEEE